MLSHDLTLTSLIVLLPLTEEQGMPPTEATSQMPSIPGAKARQHLGRKRKSSQSDDGVQAFLERQHRQLQELINSEQDRQQQENSYLESYLRAQREAEERRFEMMQAQMKENNNMFRLLLSAMSNTSAQPQHPHANYWVPNPPAPAQSNTAPTWLMPPSSTQLQPMQVLPTTGAN